MRTILITGCSSGIGHHAAHYLKDRGWRVFATCRKHEDCVRLRDEGLASFRLDLDDPASITSALAEAQARSEGRIDALFNNGAYAIPGAVEDVPTEALRAIFETNLFGWHELTCQILPIMRAQGHGRIVQNSSVLGLAALRWRGAYVATKFALEGLTDTLRLELRDSNIHVSLIEPGPITTRFRQNTIPHFERWIDWESSPHAALYRDELLARLYEPKGPDLFELPPEAVTRKLVHALESRRPRARYPVTTATHLVGLARRGLPGAMLDWVLSKN